MTQEEIQKATMAYAWKGKAKDVESIFMIAANWRINSVWHSAQEMPSRNMRDGGVGKLCLVETSDGDIEFVQACYESINGVYYFKAYFGALELFKITRWAYVKDLMPAEE